MQKSTAKTLRQVFGTEAKTPRVRQLEAGPLSAVFSQGNLSDISWRGLEILRGISWLVRDENWGTCKAEVSQTKVTTAKNLCVVRYSGVARHAENALFYQATISLAAQKLEFTVTAQPERDFRTNRTGFVVLHPIDGVAGRPVTVTHVDGTVQKSRFPKLISPGQPFFDIRSLAHRPAPGLKAHVLMEGHKFEMEDQRNWGDASFKTYVCSLLDPWPYVLKGGVSFTQKITMTLSGSAKPPNKKVHAVKLGNLRPSNRMPQIGLSVTEDDAQETLDRVDQVRFLAPAFLLGHYEVGKTQHQTLKRYARIGALSATPFRAEIVLSATKDARTEMEDVKSAFRAAGFAPTSIVVTQVHDLKSFQPSDDRPWGPSYKEMAAAAREHFPGIPIGGGMISYFTELNRKRPPKALFDFITHSICPIVHDAGDAAVMQTLETLPHIFSSARAIMGNGPYHLGPTTIAARMNPYGKDVASNPDNDRVCLAANDPRQRGSFAAVWSLGLIAAAAMAKIDALCLGTVCGPRGLLNPDGSVMPVAELFKRISCLRNERIHASFRSGLITMAHGKEVLLVGNRSQESALIYKGKKSHKIGPYRLLLQ